MTQTLNKRWRLSRLVIVLSSMSSSSYIFANTPFQLPYSFLDKVEERQFVPYEQQSKLLTGYFDIQLGAKKGEHVIGKINLRDNRYAGEKNISDRYQLRLIKGNKALSLITKTDNLGRVYGELIVNTESQFRQLGKVKFTVALLENDTVISQQNGEVNVVKEPAWQQIANNFQHYIKQQNRLSKRYRLDQKELTKILKKLNENPTTLNGPIRNLLSQSSLSKKEKKLLSKHLQTFNHTIGALAYAYKHNKNYQDSKAKAQLKQVIYRTTLEYAKLFPTKDFGSSNYLLHSDISHQWRFTDATLGAIALLINELITDLKQQNKLAMEMHQHLLTMAEQINFALVPRYKDATYPRYYMPEAELLKYSNGVWSDANRHHRQRSWLAQAIISYDYNRPLTSNPYWFTDYSPFKEANTSILPGWRPEGSFFDIKFWLDSNLQLSHRYGQSGLLPDGSISHHIGIRQDMAHIAYGFEWLADGISDANHVLANTPFAIDVNTLNAQRSVLLTSYPMMIYRGGIDFQVAGRSHYSNHLNNFATSIYSDALSSNLSAPSKLQLDYSKEMQTLKANIAQKKTIYFGSYAMWANDFLIHRSKVNEQPFYMSVKMQSARTKGAEGFAGSSPYGFHNGSGVMQIKTSGDEYNNARYGFDWHVLPGTTEEWREDKLPLSSKYKRYNPNQFAGSLAGDGAAMASFHYDRADPYASASAKKSWFFQKNQSLAMGNQVSRTKKGQNKPIVTTIDQAHFTSAISYNVNGKSGNWPSGSDIKHTFTSQKVMWFHQHNKGYIVLPNKLTNVVLTAGNKINRTEQRAKSLKGLSKEALSVFHLAIDHGITPNQDDYRYISIANVSASEMDAIADSIAEMTIINQSDVQAVYMADNLLQVVFHQAGKVQINDQLSIHSDQPAMLQLTKYGKQWQLAVTDPTHSTQLTEIKDRKSVV